MRSTCVYTQCTCLCVCVCVCMCVCVCVDRLGSTTHTVYSRDSSHEVNMCTQCTCVCGCHWVCVLSKNRWGSTAFRSALLHVYVHMLYVCVLFDTCWCMGIHLMPMAIYQRHQLATTARTANSLFISECILRIAIYTVSHTLCSCQLLLYTCILSYMGA